MAASDSVTIKVNWCILVDIFINIIIDAKQKVGNFSDFLDSNFSRNELIKDIYGNYFAVINHT